MALRAVLFDVGGPIDTELLHEALVEESLLRALGASGVEVGHAQLADASDWAVASYAPNTYQAMVFHLCAGDARLASEVHRHFETSSPERQRVRGGIELRPGIDDLIRDLSASGLLLGLAANQPVKVIEDLDRFGIGRYFAHREVSGHHGYHKPDVRLFLRACEDLGVRPEECLMVGDRIDNDIFPAKLLGMTAVLFRTGRHIAQQPRSIREVPDHEVWSVGELRAALDALLVRA
jgi:putative hydrolase of the HAD superfamily